ncbi:VWA domain-containing protein [Sulfitobacter sp. M57]|uniref:vWA domain-containing protein n=1 Tax=unclassified Sulfitobacter TaxID=196795 RepID=UPI0023E17DE8|nr:MULTISPECIES: VWA domain-containing protein [unclassified Sulfitobacter]MDF3415853.1 VWA domain-containing protein [Sulfitobacter sp. KE5]MDF3423333.1 VWA domain-containing protein [Sulfitobacter sp. KE43]MDF3434399.1 VWA domain-containing protein [Sulfitobacter sp. KE42]MDF3460039.1 VWA domain-containing protein [Sulfitobacter sp. S74]MDF3463937.1 VWA domain-containing protein [Sulfitobacter sp. Ks18]
MLRLLFSILFVAYASVASAQERANTILVLDGSGSMWGQIDGVNKIVIARDVVADLLDSFPQDQNLGLTVYGHRERGNCADIETIVAPGQETMGQIRTAVDRINPRGKTPMTDAIIAAAQALRYTEERATVILVSDGIETCNPDPCAAARALEEAGIDFTAHVVGFDVTDPKALAQMQCLAGETGGQFFTAANASELSTALTTVVAEPVYVPQTVRFVGVLHPGGAEISAPIRWNILPEAGANIDGHGPGFTLDLSGGGYDIVGIRASDGAEAGLSFEVATLEADQGQRVEVVFPEPKPDPTEMTFRAVIGTENGEAIETPVFWGITSEAGGVILKEEMANPLAAMLEQGSHSVTAYWAEQETSSPPRQFIVTADPREIVVVFEPPAITASIGAPARAVVGSTIEVTWNGPANADDFVGIGTADASGSARWRNFAPVSEGTPLQLLVPPEPGAYTISYFDDATKDVLGTAAIEVVPAEVSLSAPATVGVGETFEVAWTGPDYNDDFIGIGLVGASGSGQWKNYTHTAEGSPLRLLAPAKPGAYLIKYFLDQENWPAAEVRIDVTEPQVSLTAPREADVSQLIEVAWTGPDTPGDFVGIGRVGASGSGQWRNYTNTSEGNPLQLMTPSEPGDYVIKYFLEQDNTPLFETLITLRAPQVSLSGPASAEVGTMIEVNWTGPNTAGDFIGIGLVGASGSGQWRNYTETATGNPIQLLIPSVPGDYVIKYLLEQRNTPLIEVPIKVTPATVTLDVPSVVTGGTIVDIPWTGPDHPGDFIGIGLSDASGSGQWRSYVETSNGSPARLRIPTAGGDYAVKYFLNQRNTPALTVPVSVSTPPATLNAPAVADAGSTIEVAWTGPNYAGDYIGIGKAGASGSGQWRAYGETAGGPLLSIALPEEPGVYVMQYFVGADRVAIAERPLTIR